MEGENNSPDNFWAEYEREREQTAEPNGGGFVNLEQQIHTDKRKSREKIFSFLLIAMAFVAVFAGYYQLKVNIRNPLSVKLANTDSENCINGDCELQSRILAAWSLKQQDTDGDGLSDYDETNIYGTSPYLEDSDSDGLTDKQEVDNGSDPNCAGEENCFRDTSATTVSSNTTEQTTASPLATGNSAASEADMIRQMLLSSGISESDLANVSDAELLSLYNEAASEQSAASAGSDTNTSATVQNSTSTVSTAELDLSQIKSLADMQNISGAQLRALMIEQGAPADLLSQVSDDELKEMFLQKLQAQNQ